MRAQRHRRQGFHRAVLVRTRVRRGPRTSRRRSAAATAFRRRRLPRARLGQRHSGRRTRGRPHAVSRGHHVRASMLGSAARHRLGRGRSAGSRKAARQAGLAAAIRIRSGIRAPRASGRPCGSRACRANWICGSALDAVGGTLGDRVQRVHRRAARATICASASGSAAARACSPTTLMRSSAAKYTASMSLSDPGIDDYRNELLWSPERPTLLEAEIQLLRGDEVIDEVQSYTALRVDRRAAREDHAERPALHDAPGARPGLLAGYFHDPALRATRCAKTWCWPSRWVSMACASIRSSKTRVTSTGPTCSACWCGTRCRAPIASRPAPSTASCASGPRPSSATSAIRASSMWVPFNESWGVPELSTTPAPRDAVAAFYHLTRTLDPSRLVVGNDGWESSATDVIGIHDYDCDPAHMHVRYGPEVTPKEVVDQPLDGGPPADARRVSRIAASRSASPSSAASPSSPGRPTTATRTGDTRARARVEEFESMACGVIEAARTTGMFSRLLLHAVRRHLPGSERPAVCGPHAEDSAGAHRGGGARLGVSGGDSAVSL